MTRIGVISNARSKRNKSSMRDFFTLLSQHPQVLHRSFYEISDLGDCLAYMAAENVSHLVISGGDGTVQAAVSQLINSSPFRQMPKLSLLSAGMTNVIARDVGLRDLPAVGLRRLVERAEAGYSGELIERPVISLDLGDDGPMIHGFLLGAIGFYQGTLLGRRDVHRLGAQQGLAAKLSIAWSVGKFLWQGPGPKSVFNGERVVLGIDNDAATEQDLFMLLSTTLDSLLPGIMPFWGEGRGAIKLTTIDHPPKRFASAVLPILLGRPKPWMSRAGYHGRRVDRIFIEMKGPVVMDGEIFETDGGQSVSISTGPTMQFHRY
jgi:diacylglycerol kinase (ATP)